MLNKIQIMTDSTSDLPPSILKEHGIGVVPLRVVFGEQSFRDGVDITTEELYRRVEESGKLPKTSAASPAEFVEYFKPHIDEGKSILYISLSSGLSATYQNALIAANEFPEGRIEVVDSRNLSTGIGLLVMKAVDYIREGESDLKRLADRLREDTARVETEFAIDTLDYLHKGGRCSGTQKVFGTMLRIHPLIKVVDGGMILADKVRGKEEKVLETLLNRALQFKDNMDPARIFVTHSMGESKARWLKEQLESRLDVREVLISDAGCVISSHCGPGTVGILFMKKTA